MPAKVYKIGPSDLSYLWEDCKRCFWAKVIGGRKTPGSPFPAIFRVVDGLMKSLYDGFDTEIVADAKLAAGKFSAAKEWVTSRPFPKQGERRFIFSGKRDINIEFADGSLGIVDFKFAKLTPEKVAKYERQVRAYEWAMEHPDEGEPRQVSKLGLISFEPDSMIRPGGEPKVSDLKGTLKWHEIPGTKEVFEATMRDIVTVLSQDTPPEGKSGCAWCKLYGDVEKAAAAEAVKKAAT